MILGKSRCELQLLRISLYCSELYVEIGISEVVEIPIVWVEQGGRFLWFLQLSVNKLAALLDKTKLDNNDPWGVLIACCVVKFRIRVF